MARANNQDRTGQATPRETRPVQAVDHGLPWNTSGTRQLQEYPNDPQFDGASNEPQFAGQPPPAGYPTPYGQPGYPGQPMPQPGGLSAQWPPHAGQPYPPSGYPTQPPFGQQVGYPPQGAYAVDPQLGQYLPQAAAAQGYPPAAQAYPPTAEYPDPAPHLRGSYAPHDTAFAGGGGYLPQQGYAPQPGAADPQAYELGGYTTAPPAYARMDPRTQPSGRPVPAPQSNGGYGVAYGQPQPAGHYIDPTQNRGQPPGMAPNGYPSPNQLQADQVHSQAHAAGADDDFDDDYEDDEDETPEPRRFGLLKIAASLVVAISVGAGAAYGYKIYSGKLSGGRAPVVLKADASPSKSRPVGQQSAALAADGAKSDERLGDGVPNVVPTGDQSGDPTAPAGARRVQTIAIAPPVAGLQPSVPAGAPMKPTISTMPGLVVEGPSAPVPQQRTVTQPPVVAAPVGRAAPVAPKLMASLEPATAAAVVVAPKALPKRARVAKVPKSGDAYTVQTDGVATVASATTTASAAPASAAAGPKAGANGYVCVLFSSTGSAIDARKSLDTLQAKYGDALAGKPTDVAEVTVNGKLYYRGIVGPPASRDATNTMCGQLKTAGLPKDSFVAAY